MKTTNNHQLPEAFMRFAEKNAYSKGDADISVTSLIDSPRVFNLRQQYDEDISQDISEQVFSLLGTAVHLVLEQGASKDSIAEERIFLDLEKSGGKRLTLSGAIDLQSPSNGGWILSDYKTCSTATLMYAQEGKPEWHKQLNCYAELVEEGKGEKVVGLEVIAICRDWTASKAYQKGYPALPIVRISIPMWTSERRKEYIDSRIQAHQLQKLCNAQDRWAKPGKFAVMRENRSRAVKIFDTRKGAEEYIEELRGGGYSVEYRPTKHIRCENNYCQVADFCDQWKDIKSSQELGE